MAMPLKRFTTTRSVVAARAAKSGQACAARLTARAIKAIRGRNPVPQRSPFLSCRCAVIVGTDNIRVGGHRTQPKAVPVGVRLRRRPEFATQGFFYDFRITPRRG